VGDRSVAHFEILAESVERKRRTDPLRQEVRDVLQHRQVADGFQFAHVLPEEPVETLRLPAAQYSLGLSEVRLRKSAVLHERCHQILPPLRGDRKLLSRNEFAVCGLADRFPVRKRVKTVMVGTKSSRRRNPGSDRR
jgi:hypothetical protein